MRRLALLAFVLVVSSGCLVVSVNPAHERDALVAEPALLGSWQNADDNSTLKIEAGEWSAYNIEYTHPIEKGRLTGYLTTIGGARYLDVMPARGEDRGSFVLPLHVVVRVQLEGDELVLTPLSYDWFFDRLKARTPISGLTAVLDEKENALIASSTQAMRAWIARQPAESKAFGASATFKRKP